MGERCYLSPIDPADAPAFTAWLNDAEVAAGVTFTRRVINVEQERDGLARLAAKPYTFAIVSARRRRAAGQLRHRRRERRRPHRRAGHHDRQQGVLESRLGHRGGAAAVALRVPDAQPEQHHGSPCTRSTNVRSAATRSAGSSAAATGPNPGTTTAYCTAPSRCTCCAPTSTRDSRRRKKDSRATAFAVWLQYGIR